MDKYEQILLKALNEANFFTNEDLRMNRKYNILLGSQELKEFLIFKDTFSHKLKVELPLRSFNSFNMYYYNCDELSTVLGEYLEFLKCDLTEREASIISDNYEDVIISRLASELEILIQTTLSLEI